MKREILILIIIFSSILSLNAQSFKATYTYDANGNRDSAKVFYLTFKSATIDTNQVDSAEIIKKLQLENTKQLDSLSNFFVRIFPNPAQKDLLIEINGLGFSEFDGKSNFIKLLSLNGQLMLDIKPVSSYNTIDLTRFNQGTYILLLNINGKAQTYRIIKN